MNDGTNHVSREQIEATIKNIVDNQEMLEATFKPLAEMLFQKREALVNAGFTLEEAMQLIAARGLHV